MFGNLFKKKVTIVDTKSQADAERIEKTLSDAGVWVHSWEEYPKPVLGGAHMKTADWADNKLMQKSKDGERVIYHIDILAEETGKAKLALENSGLDF